MRIRTPRLQAMIFALAGVLAAGGAGAAIIVVNDSSDALHGLGCAASGMGTCTLRDAIIFANAHAGLDEIHFAIAGSGVHTITLDSDIPTVSEELIIDGYTQSGSSPNTNGPGLGDNAVLTIEINGNGHGCFAFGYGRNSISGLVINRCGGSGILVSGSAEIAGNFIGVDAAGGAPLPNETGVQSVEAAIVGGPAPGARNVISGNHGAGISGCLWGVQGNFIGTDATGTIAVPNGGSGIGAVGCVRPSISGNLISGNAGKGISLEAGLEAEIRGNHIGTDISGTLPLGNRSTGVFIIDHGDPAGVVSGNTIAFNGGGDPIGGGILSWSWSHHWYWTNPTILGNSIFENTSDGSLPGRGLGILLVGAGNTPCDIYFVGAEPQNSPALTLALTDGSEIRVRGMLNTSSRHSSNDLWRIELFASPSCDPSGGGEGQTFLGSTDVHELCDAEFDVTFPATMPVGQFITATATDLSTSQFSACIPLQSAESVGVVNPLVTLVAMTTQRGPNWQYGSYGDEGETMVIRATFKNTSSTPIGTPFFVVTELTGGNFLNNADSGIGGRLTPNVGSDHVLSPGETFVAQFDVGLRTPSRFTFFVDLWGDTGPQ